jgi:hypothetical protein
VPDLEMGTDVGPLPPPPSSATHKPPNRGKGTQPAYEGVLRFAGYEIVERIGKGRYGEVYQAQQTGLNRMVTIEFLGQLDVLASEKRSFRHIIETLVRLGHKHILHVYDVGENLRGNYHATESYCSTLAERLELSALTPHEILRVALAVGKALEAAHKKNIIHGDVCAANVHWVEEGTVKLGGFGLARLMSDKESDAVDDMAELGKLMRECGATLPAELETIAQRCVAGSKAEDVVVALEECEHRWNEQASDERQVGFMARQKAIFKTLFIFVLAVLLLLSFTLAGLLHSVDSASWLVDASFASTWVGAKGGTFENSAAIKMAGREGEPCIVGMVSWQRPGGGRVPVLLVGGAVKDDTQGPLAILDEGKRNKLQKENTIIVSGAEGERLGLSGKPDEPGIIDETHVRVVEQGEYPTSPFGPVVLCSVSTAQRVLKMSREETTFLLGGVGGAGVKTFTREALSLQLRERALFGSPLSYLWLGFALGLILVAGYLGGRFLSPNKGHSRAGLFVHVAIVILVATIVVQGMMRIVPLRENWPRAYTDSVLTFLAMALLLVIAGSARVRNSLRTLS